MNITYDNGHTEELRNLMNDEVHDKLREAMKDPHFMQAIIRAEHPGIARTPRKNVPLSELQRREQAR